METIGFLGLGNMGLPMALNLVSAGYNVKGYDISPMALENAQNKKIEVVSSVEAAVKSSQIVITMLPSGQHVYDAYMEDGGIFAYSSKEMLFIDCSTIDVENSLSINNKAREIGCYMIDAPVSGGIAGAQAASLAIMVGGDRTSFHMAVPVLEHLGSNIVHAGKAGSGQIAKMCNNMILGISMIGVCEAFCLADKFGLDRQKLFDISSKASGQCWSLTSYCPVPGPVPSSPSNRGYEPGFTAKMMLKDLNLARESAQKSNLICPLGAHAADLYDTFVENFDGDLDFSAIISMLKS